MERPLTAHTLNEVRCYLQVTPCPDCGKGPWVYDSAGGQGGQTGAKHTLVQAHCGQCGTAREFAFDIQHELQTWGPEGEQINPSPRPSRLIDLAQWMSLFYMLVETASRDESPAESRRTSFRAALCLREALKFYEDNELPPESAFFRGRSREVFRDHPEKFARQRLQDMQAKLPSMAVMTRRLKRDERVQRKKWWQFWKF